jgi:multiple sugar transport system substrate-binding protein
MKYGKLCVTAGVAAVMFMSGCSLNPAAQNDGAGKVDDNNEPVTLNIITQATGPLVEQEIHSYMIEPVKKKFPNISIQIVPVAMSMQGLEKLATQGVTPDLYLISSNIMDPLIQIGYVYNMESLIKSSGMNLSRFDSASLEALKSVSGGNFLASLPFSRNFSALYYNKDIFDKFGVPYPKDGMTWEAAIELAKQLSRTENGIAYSGLNTGQIHRVASQLSLGYVDKATGKSIVNSPQWKRVYEMAKSLYSLSGNGWVNEGAALKQFQTDKSLAMYAHLNQLQNLSKNPELNWDLSTYPTFAEAPGKGVNFDLQTVGLAATSPHKEAAFKVISVMMSDEVQTEMSKNGKLSVLKDEKIRSVFLQNLDYMKGKNSKAILGITPATNFVSSKYDSQIRNLINEKYAKEIFVNGMDINTALRLMEEEANKLIEADGKN